MIVLPIQIAFLSFITIPASFAVFMAPVFKFLFEFTYLTLQITRMILSVSFLWVWELALKTEFIDVLAVIISVYISTKVILDFFSYEIVFDFNSDQREYEQQVDLN